MVDHAVVRHWLVSGPSGKIYEFENKVILEIPNRFFCTQSTDPNDLSVQASTLFSPILNNYATRLELQVSFWESERIKNGQATRLAMDIIKTDDTFLEDCLEDLKHHIEVGQTQ